METERCVRCSSVYKTGTKVHKCPKCEESGFECCFNPDGSLCDQCFGEDVELEHFDFDSEDTWVEDDIF